MEAMTSIQHDSLWSVTRGRRARYLSAILAMVLSNVFMFGAPLAAKYAIDAVVARDLGAAETWVAPALRALGAIDPFGAYLWLSALAILLLTAAGGAFQYLRGRLAATASESIARSLREALYARLHRLRADFYDEADTGDLVQRCSSDVETLRVFLSVDVVEIGRAVLLVLTVAPILIWLDSGLAAVSLALMPFLTVFAYVFFKKVKRVFAVTDAAEGEMTAVLQENLTGIRVVRAFARQDFEIQKFGRKNAAFRDHNRRLIELMGLYWAAAELVALSQVGLVLFAGAFWIASGRITVGTLFAFLTYEAMILWPVRQLGRVLTDSGKAVVSLKRVNEILTAREETREVARGPDRADGEIRFDHVTFGYGGKRPVIDDLTVHVEAGETLAIVGAPGSGKSTLIRLLLRLYEPQHGGIFIDGRDVRTASRQWLRRQIGIVPQDPFLYSRTVEANLRVGRSDARHDHLEIAARDAAIHDSIERFAEGYRTLVGERGVTLSGGQRQRLALARALLKDPAVLVLDDSLSAVDTGTESRILDALRRRKGRHTTIVIAHRLSSVMHADRIMVLERGRCVQLGDHAALSRVEGPYKRLCEIQGDLDAEIRDDVEMSAVAENRS
ncbi:MAG TPA: ABC transporter ATP-binding protein [Gammaproteobacteria bacterium]|nr:ABC transporter ATP-binding protein [Gammaproteobacteria bacterium]